MDEHAPITWRTKSLDGSKKPNATCFPGITHVTHRMTPHRQMQTTPRRVPFLIGRGFGQMRCKTFERNHMRNGDMWLHTRLISSRESDKSISITNKFSESCCVRPVANGPKKLKSLGFHMSAPEVFSTLFLRSSIYQISPQLRSCCYTSADSAGEDSLQRIPLGRSSRRGWRLGHGRG